MKIMAIVSILYDLFGQYIFDITCTLICNLFENFQ